MAESRNISKSELFKSFCVLVDKDTFAWYKQIKTLVTDWDSLIERLKKDFLPPYADDDIWEEIKARKQKSSESITIFVANLEILFNRLTSVPSEITRVKYIKNTLLSVLKTAKSIRKSVF